MGNEKKNSSLDTFAWLIYQEVEKYVNENADDYKQWLSAQNLVDNDKQVANDNKSIS